MAVHNLEEVMSLTMDEIYEGRRKYPRVELNSVMMIEAPNGESCQAKVVNISMDGAQINCDKTTAKLILPKDASVVDKQAPKIKGTFELEIDGELKKIQAECRIYYVVSLDGVSVSFGLLFEHLDEAGSEIIDQYIMKTMEEYH